MWHYTFCIQHCFANVGPLPSWELEAEEQADCEESARRKIIGDSMWCGLRVLTISLLSVG